MSFCVKVFLAIVALSTLSDYYVVECQAPTSFYIKQFYPTKNTVDAIKSEVLQCRSIRDVIKRNTVRYKKVLVRNDNPKIDFGSVGDNKYMTSRAKSKLDVLASRVQSQWGSGVRLRVIKAWTDVVDKKDMLSLHYEGRTLKLQTTDGDKWKLGRLCGLASESGFDWVYFEDWNFIRVSVIPDVCQTKLDMAFVIDTSGSVGYYNFQKVQQFLKNLVDYYNIGQDQTRLGLISYSYSVYREFYLNSYGTKSKIKAAIDDMYYEGSMTATGDALVEMKDYIFDSNNGMRSDKSIPKVGILLTDGRSNQGRSVYSAAQAVKKAGISMFVIGVGSNLRQSELNDVASDPDSEHVFRLNGFYDLSGFVDQMSTTSCDEGAQLSQCESAETAVDGGSFKYFRGSFSANTAKVTIEVVDKQGRSFLYTSLTNKNPGPLDPKSETNSNTGSTSPRASTVTISSTRLLYMAVQGQEDSNRFILNIWDSLFPRDEYKSSISENLPVGQRVTFVTSNLPGYTFHYTIQYGNTAGHFSMNKFTGELTTTRQLDRESVASYSLVIVAQDANLRCHKGRTLLTVTVLDQNDNTPVFLYDPYNFTIPETIPVGSIIGTVSARDGDAGDNGRLQYAIISGFRKEDFTIDANTGQIKVAKALDFEMRAQNYKLKAMVMDGASPSRSSYADLKIKVLDVDEPPKFTVCVRGCNVSINEGDTTNRPLITVLAESPDILKQDANLQYQIVSSDKYYFNIGKKYPTIRTSRPIDRELKDVYTLIVEVQDVSKLLTMKDRTTITVTALDVNDNAPKFPVTRYSALVMENKPSGTSVITVSASDLDIGSNKAITYSIKSGNRGNHFKIDPTSGRITTLKPVDREALPQVTMEVCATDGGSPNKTTCVYMDISIGDENDNTPKFQGNKTFSVVENANRGTSVGTVQSKDEDTGINGKVRCSMAGGNTGNAFSIDADSCLIRTAGVIDRETVSSYSLLVRIADLGRPSLSTTSTYTVTVQDENDNSPVFSSGTYRASVKENAAVSTSLIKVTAKDNDIGINARITYSIKSGDDAVAKFAINASSGDIRLKSALSFGVKNSYRLEVEAKDGAAKPRSGTAYVLISVQDTNDFTPVFSPTTYRTGLPENSPVGQSVDYFFQVTATDRDTGPSGILAYSIESGNVDNAFTIASQSGEFRVNRKLDHENIKSYNLRIKARDNGSPSRQGFCTVIITVTDVNDNPPSFISNPFRMSVFENASIGFSIGNIQATDKDSNDNANIDYETLTKGTPITVDKNGDVKVSSILDFETTKQYTIKLKASDWGNPILSDTSQLIVTVKDSNDNSPQFPGKPYTCEILENSPSSTVVCYVVATDADVGDNAKLTYVIAASAGSQCPFTIDSTTGKIKATKALDRETKSSYSCQVTARDAGTPPRSSNVEVAINVKDENDNTPVANPSSYTFSIVEEQVTNLTAGEILAADKDAGSNSRLVYQLTSSGIVKSLFKVDAASGIVSATSKLNREVASSYTMNIRVSDNGKPSLFANVPVTVNVEDINDNTPVFSKTVYTSNIREDSAVGSNIVQVSAADADAGTNAQITYEITGGLHRGNFSISKTGLLVTTQALDYETLASYDLTVTAKDGGKTPKRATAKVSISVINVDDNAPVFGKVSEAKVSEAVQVGTPIVKFNATDKDGSRLTYAITKGNTASAFEIHASTGQLRVKNSLDRETTAKYNLTVTVTDTSSKKTTTHLPIKVLDVNDNVPKFYRDQYSTNIRENKPSGYSCVRVYATDQDEGTNGKIEYEIQSGATKDLFRILYNGDIELLHSLDRELHASHQLVVTAKDKGTPSLKSSVVVNINVKDENDNSPVFDQIDPKQITENCGIHATVAVVRATDRDAADYGRVSYTIVSENGGNVVTFEIGGSDGVLLPKMDLDRETRDFYSLVIEANDNPRWVPMKKTRAILNITVSDQNDNSPRITSPAKISPVSEDSLIDTLVARFDSTDADIGINAQVVYDIVSGNTGNTFKINRNTGELKVAKAINREKTSAFRLEIRAEDKGQPALRSTRVYDIAVKDVNDNGPVFTKTSYTGSVEENVAHGTSVMTVVANDADKGANAQVTYSLKQPLTFSSSVTAFTIDPKTGQINTTKDLDYETTSSYRFTVFATDGKFNSSAVVNIKVGNLNDNSPGFSKVFTATVSESLPVSSHVLTVTATDEDALGALTYSLMNCTGTFSIDRQTGDIKTTVGLDRETTSKYVIGVNVTDVGSPSLSSQTTATVLIGDFNDNAPYFTTSSVTVAVKENTTVNAFFTVKAYDKDIGTNAELVYSIQNGASSSSFKIDQSTGEISTSRKLDRESVSSHVISIVAKDKGSPPLTSQPFVLSITVIDVNDNSPLFLEKYNNESISEGASVGTGVFGALATDLDTGVNAEIEYSIVDGNIGDVFAVDNTTGAVSVKKQLDRESTDRYMIKIQAMDHGVPSRSSTTTATIFITDINDNAPVFDNRRLTGYVMENRNAGTSVVTVKATDKDAGENALVKYSMKTNDAFSIDEVTGEVQTLKPFDREEKDRYTVEVTAKDHGAVPMSTTKTLTVIINDADDNCPVFSPKTYRATIAENPARGTVVLNVTATDDDTGLNAELRYAIKSGDDQGGFTVDPVSGQVKVVGIVDREYSGIYHLKVRGGKSDCGTKPTNDTNVGEGGIEQANNQSLADVYITVTDKNDNPPKFQSKIVDYDFNSIADKIQMNLTATDPDLGVGGIVKFRLNATKRVNQNGLMRRDVIIEAYDQGSPSLSSTATVKVHNKMACSSMSFDVTPSGLLSTSTLCLFTKTPEGVFRKIVGQPFKLECEASGNEVVLYRWLKDGNSIAAWSKSGNLNIENVTRDDAGRYACLATNGGGTIQSTNAELIVQEKPTLLKQPQSSTVEVGGTAIFECEARADPRPDYRWYKNNEIYQQGVGFRTKRLVLSEVIPNDEGEYICEAFNTVGNKKSKVATLKVVDLKTVVALQVSLNNPDEDGKCHYFIPTSFEKTLSKLTNKTVAVTKVDKSKFCNITACQPNPCSHGGKCDLTKKGIHCSCKGGWVGATCKDDVNECAVGSGDCINGKCNNVNGSYWCACAKGKSGKNCQLSVSACAGSPCSADHVCLPLPKGPRGNYTCIPKMHKFALTIELAGGWEDHMKYIVEEDLNEAVQNWKPPSSRRRRSVTQATDFRSCVTRVTGVQTQQDNKVNVEYVFVCPKNVQKNISKSSDYLCRNMLNTMGKSKDCKVEGGVLTTKSPAVKLPVVKFKIELVVRDKSSGVALGATEALDILQKDEVLGKLANQNIKVQHAAQAYKTPGKQTGKKESNSTTVAISVSAGIIACLAILALGVYITIRRKRNQDITTSKTMAERIARRRQSKEDLIRADLSMNTIGGGSRNMGFAREPSCRDSYTMMEDTFMYDAPGKLIKEGETNKSEETSSANKEE